MTPYDIVDSMNQISRAFSKPSKSHMAAEKRVLPYIKGHTNLGHTHKHGVPYEEGFSDTPFSSKPGTR